MHIQVDKTLVKLVYLIQSLSLTFKLQFIVVFFVKVLHSSIDYRKSQICLAELEEIEKSYNGNVDSWNLSEKQHIL